jgi:acetyl-CoA decarbonylase/synthase complex subunit gamma
MVRMRLGIARTSYTTPPGLYALGRPDAESPVLVTANYRMTFDIVRSAMAGHDLWILVLDTKGINVWCAAGKGTFGTDELVGRIEATGLSDVVTHRRLILPQLGATGVRGHEVAKRSGFRVTWGPVRIHDLPAFMKSGMKATPAMRRVTFSFAERLVLTPIEITGSWKISLVALFLCMIVSGLGKTGFHWRAALIDGASAFLLYCAALITGAVVTPLLLPWLPGRPFSIKGAIAGIAIILAIHAHHPVGLHWLLLFPALASFTALNFTGATTFTSLAGVKREIRIAVPLHIVAGGAGLIAWIAGRLA